jgi:hypothetical protein
VFETSSSRYARRGLHVASEFSAGLEQCLSDLPNSAVFDYFHHAIEEIAAVSSDLLEFR